jgi:ribosomal protein L34E
MECQHTRYELRGNGIVKCLQCGVILQQVIHRIRGIRIVTLKEVKQ